MGVTSPADEALRVTAEAAARAAGDHALAQVGTRAVISARTRNDIKLELDAECQVIAERVIRDTFPGHVVMGEEAGSFSEEAEYLWIIDPIDGTVNYFNGIPHWCSSVAVRQGGTMAGAAVYAPNYRECFTAVRNGGATCNGKPLQVSQTARLTEATVLTGLSALLQDEDERMARCREILRRTSKIRVLGAAALDICFVSAGRADGLFEYAVNVWDYAAGMLIAEEAGARFELIYVVDEIRRGCLCTNGRIHDELMALVVGDLETRSAR